MKFRLFKETFSLQSKPVLVSYDVPSMGKEKDKHDKLVYCCVCPNQGLFFHVME